MINLYSRDLSRAAAFYSELGFVETLRTPASGEPLHIELTLDGLTLGIATIEAAKEHHGLQPVGEGRWIEIGLWTEDTDAALSALVAKGALFSPLPMISSTASCAPPGLLIRMAIPSNWFKRETEPATLGILAKEDMLWARLCRGWSQRFDTGLVHIVPCVLDCLNAKGNMSQYSARVVHA